MKIFKNKFGYSIYMKKKYNLIFYISIVLLLYKMLIFVFVFDIIYCEIKKRK